MKKNTIKKICYGAIFTITVLRIISDCIEKKKQIKRLKRINNRLQSEVDDLEEMNELFIVSNIDLKQF